MRFKATIKKHTNSAHIIVPAAYLKSEGLEVGDTVYVDLIKPKRETFCRDCIHSADCWVRNAMMSKTSTLGLTESEMNIVIRASKNECDLYDGRDEE